MIFASFLRNYSCLFVLTSLLKRVVQVPCIWEVYARRAKNYCHASGFLVVDFSILEIAMSLKCERGGKQMLEVAGVQVPVRLRQQLEQERQSVEEKTHRSAGASRVEDAPRLTHKLLRVHTPHLHMILVGQLVLESHLD